MQYPVSQQFFHPLVKGAYAGKAAKFYLDSGSPTIRGVWGTHSEFLKQQRPVLFMVHAFMRLAISTVKRQVMAIVESP